MAKKKKMDRIDLKVAAARAEGLSYGQWVAKHPEGLPPGFKPQEPEELEEIETPGPVPATPKKKKTAIPAHAYAGQPALRCLRPDVQAKGMQHKVLLL